MKIGEQSKALPDVFPGRPVRFTDTDDTGERVVVVSCNPEDDGGLIHRQAKQRSREIFNRALRVVGGKKSEGEVIISEDGSADLPITTKVGRIVLSFQHY